MSNMLCEASLCTGCGACRAKCPQDAIVMKADEEGFLRPIIDEAVCNECDLCTKACPILEAPSVERETPNEAYACWNLDEAVLAESASGGMFSLFADYILEQGGVVFGAAFDEDLRVRHIAIDAREELVQARGAKYSQSDTGNNYCEVKELLGQDRDVLFTGTPCQVAGLYGFLGGDHERLLTCDLVCHGVGSPLVFSAYLEHMREKHGSALTDVNYRSKRLGWGQGRGAIRFNDGQTLNFETRADPFYFGYVSSLYLRPSCYSCPYATTPRYGDITLGEFWGLGKQGAFRHSKKQGVSVALTNSARGAQVFADRMERTFCEARALAEAEAGNPMLCRPSRRPPQREAFFADFQQQPFEAVVAKHLRRKLTLGNRLGRILRCIRRIIG